MPPKGKKTPKGRARPSKGAIFSFPRVSLWLCPCLCVSDCDAGTRVCVAL